MPAVDRAAHVLRALSAHEPARPGIGISELSRQLAVSKSGQTIGTISIAGVNTRVGEQLYELAVPVMDAAAQTSLRLGAPREGRWQSDPRASSSSSST